MPVTEKTTNASVSARSSELGARSWTGDRVELIGFIFSSHHGSLTGQGKQAGPNPGQPGPEGRRGQEAEDKLPFALLQGHRDQTPRPSTWLVVRQRFHTF